MTDILVLCPYGLDAGLISKATELTQGKVIALVSEAEMQMASLYGADVIYALPQNFAPVDELAFAKYLSSEIPKWEAKIVLAPATVQMRAVMPMLASLLQAGLTADCTHLSLENGKLIQTRPAFGNSLMADIETVSDYTLATVRTGIYKPQKLEKTPEIHNLTPHLEEKVTLTQALPFQDGVPLTTAKILVAGGLGVGSKEGFEKLAELAKKLGGAVAASRAAVDAGFAPYRCQVGVTGAAVCPDVYIAVGISGAVQHLSGMSGAGKVIAINTDPKAPIFDYADYGIVAPWEDAINQLLEELS